MWGWGWGCSVLLDDNVTFVNKPRDRSGKVTYRRYLQMSNVEVASYVSNVSLLVRVGFMPRNKDQNASVIIKY